MTLLTIRAHRRYAVRQPVRLALAGRAAAEGLLIELSCEGCRISNLGRAALAVGDPVTVGFGEVSLPGRIRWTHDGLAGVRLDQPLHSSQLARLIALGREEPEAEARRYGT